MGVTPRRGWMKRELDKFPPGSKVRHNKKNCPYAGETGIVELCVKGRNSVWIDVGYDGDVIFNLHPGDLEPIVRRG